MPYKDEQKRKEYHRKYNAVHYSANREQIREREQAHRDANRENVNELERARYAANREKITARNRVRYAAQREEEKERKASYYPANRDKVNQRNTDYYADHREETLATQRLYVASDPAKQKSMRRKNAYNLSAIDYYILLEKQGYQCAICSDWLDLGKRTHIDHCHDTKCVRGVLCGHCNQMLGHARDNTATLQKAIDYLNSGGNEVDKYVSA